MKTCIGRLAGHAPRRDQFRAPRAVIQRVILSQMYPSCSSSLINFPPTASSVSSL